MLPPLSFSSAHCRMRVLCLVKTFVLFAFLCCPVASVTAQKPCEEPRVTYGAHQPSGSEFQIAKAPPMLKPQTGTLKKSTHEARWLYQDDPDFTKNGPWSTTITVGDHNGASWLLTFPQHGNEAIQSDWLNEKLLFLRVWLGRLVSLDMILDVDKGVLIYSEDATFDDLMPCASTSLNAKPEKQLMINLHGARDSARGVGDSEISPIRSVATKSR
jgi:hypothetical protein